MFVSIFSTGGWQPSWKINLQNIEVASCKDYSDSNLVKVCSGALEILSFFMFLVILEMAAGSHLGWSFRINAK